MLKHTRRGVNTVEDIAPVVTDIVEKSEQISDPKPIINKRLRVKEPVVTEPVEESKGSTEV